MYGQPYTPAEIAFLKDHISGRSHKELTRLFNARFGCRRSESQITAACKNRKLNNGLSGRFKPGAVPYNKGKKGITYPGMEATQFKPGHVSTRHRPVGSERVNVDGYAEVKVAEPRKWRPKHVVVWEAANGAVPAGHVVIFGDGNRQNITLDNLLLISRRQLAVANKARLLGGTRELTETGLLIADIKMASTRRIKRLQRKD